VHPLRESRPFANFSGGNQQKIVFAKWLRLNPRLLILDEPTQGVDIGAMEDIYRMTVEHARAGNGVLLLSNEWDDLARVADRVIIMQRGRIAAELEGDELTADGIADQVFTTTDREKEGGRA
jgi:ribose transport system ATP-binding protein